MTRSAAEVLIVDDEPVIRGLLENVLVSRGHKVLTAENGVDALGILRVTAVDMVISDIQMPVMDGFELFSRLEREFPRVKRVLMTGCDIDEYLAMIREYNIGNVLSKGGDFHIGEITRYIESLLDGTIFGLEHYFEDDKTDCADIRCQDDSERACRQILELYLGPDKIFLEIALNELISNAVFHGVLQMSGVPRDQWDSLYRIDDETPIRVCWASDSEKVGICIEDPVGRLKKKDVLRWLDHPIGQKVAGEEHGRGLMLVRKLIDRFVINIDPGIRTECIVIQHHDRALARQNKPLLVNEI